MKSPSGRTKTLKFIWVHPKEEQTLFKLNPVKVEPEPYKLPQGAAEVAQKHTVLTRCPTCGAEYEDEDYEEEEYDEDDFEGEDFEEEDRWRCHGEAHSTKQRCRWMCPDKAHLPKKGLYYCHWHNPNLRCHGKALTTGQRCRFICANPSIVIDGRCYCQQHDPTKSSFRCHGFAITKDRECEIICNPSQVQKGVPYCEYHKISSPLGTS
ncbi:unnamed protein product [Mortierella alpina]